MAYTFNTGLKLVASKYTNLTKARVTRETIQQEIEGHPFYPSLLSLSDTFNRYNIDNEAYKIKKEDINNLGDQLPFVALIKINKVGNDFVLVTEITNERVTYLYRSNKPISVSNRMFLDSYQEIIWKAELSEKSGQSNYNEVLKKEKLIKKQKFGLIFGYVLLFLIAISNCIYSGNAISISIITTIKIIGFCISWFLLAYEIDNNNAFVKNICNISSKTDCDAVLNSTASHIGGVSWGEVGFIYFSSTMIGILLPNIAYEYKAIWIAIGNFFAVPYIIFSIYYQWRVIKQWCVLCLTIQIILLAELIWAIIFAWKLKVLPDIFNLSTLLSLLFSILLPSVAWFTLKPILRRSNDYSLYLNAYKRLRYNPDVFNKLLKQQPKVPTGWEEIGINMGNENAQHTVIKICNPYCGPCNQAHPILEDLIESNKNVNLKIIYITPSYDSDMAVLIISHILSIYDQRNEQKLKNFLNDWYTNKEIDKRYELISHLYPVEIFLLERYYNRIDAMNKWCDIAHIIYTPTIFIDGYRLPENYDVSELKYVL